MLEARTHRVRWSPAARGYDRRTYRCRPSGYWFGRGGTANPRPRGVELGLGKDCRLAEHPRLRIESTDPLQDDAAHVGCCERVANGDGAVIRHDCRRSAFD